MAQPAGRRDYQAIVFISDDEDDEFTEDDNVLPNARPVGELIDYEESLDGEIFDLTAIPDVDVPPAYSSPRVVGDAELVAVTGGADIITEAMCLQLILDVFPDVSVNYVLTRIQERSTDHTRTKEHSESIINELLEDDYPKEAHTAGRKRRREDSEEESDYEKDERDVRVTDYEEDAIALLKDEFLNVPLRHITNTFKQRKTLFKAYITLEEQVRTYQKTTRVFAKPPRPRNKCGTELALIERGSRVPRELRAAKRKIETETGECPDSEYALHGSITMLTKPVKRRKVEETKRAEEANTQQAKMDNHMGECQCCFTEYPLNRMISCSGKGMHLFCLDCPKQYIETEMGQSKCRPVCFASTECEGTFSRAQLQQVLSEKSFERLEHMQQQQELAAAGLDFLSECPFCDFKQECPPVDVDKEFRCQSVKCGKTSCRLCNRETHIPLSCEEAKKDGQLTLRHVVEEAMSAALIRKCNKCQHPFVKDYGCNKMVCSHCGNKQCYICSKNVVNYEHFGDVNKGRCALHDNVEDVHEQAVKKAADEAMAMVKAENPNLSDADLMVQVSDRVKQAELARRKRAADRLNDFPFEMVEDQLVHRREYQVVEQPLPLVGGRPPPPAPPLRLFAGFGDAIAAPYNGLAGVGALQQLRALNQEALDILADVGHRLQAPEHPLQQQVRGANPRAHHPNRAVDAQGFQAQMDRMDAEMVARRRRRVPGVQQRFGEVERLRRALEDMAQPEMPDFAPAEPPANARDAGAGADVGGGLAFRGLDANRALRRRELNNWFEEQLRNVPRQ